MSDMLLYKSNKILLTIFFIINQSNYTVHPVLNASSSDPPKNSQLFKYPCMTLVCGIQFGSKHS